MCHLNNDFVPWWGGLGMSLERKLGASAAAMIKERPFLRFGKVGPGVSVAFLHLLYMGFFGYVLR